jgi:pimeloyl-ACP methyl ester carboxylesterase
MLVKPTMILRCSPPQTWQWNATRRSSGDSKSLQAILPSWLHGLTNFEIASSGELVPTTPSPRRSTGYFTATPADGANYLLLLRHADGACWIEPFSSPSGSDSSTLDARIVLPPVSHLAGRRRGIIGKAVRVVVLKIAGNVVGKALPALANNWETAYWRKNALIRGLGRVNLDTFDLEPATATRAAKDQRALLLLHGTFSHTRSAFRDFAAPAIRSTLADLYPGGIFGFNHFTISESVEENSAGLYHALLSLQQQRTAKLDVITHSRGGLLLRQLLMMHPELEAQIGKIVMVACPNLGTPIASPERWKEHFNWLANLIECFPECPLATAADYLVNALPWLASHVTGALPGLGIMAPDSAALAKLQQAETSWVRQAALYGAHYNNPEDPFLRRVATLEIARFFREPHDLVVPTKGSMMLRQNDGFSPAADSLLGCGRNGKGEVHHLNFFRHVRSLEKILGYLHEVDQSRRSSRKPVARGTSAKTKVNL